MERNASFDVFDGLARLFARAPAFLGYVRRAVHLAAEHRYKAVGIEHLLRVLTDDSRFSSFIEAADGDALAFRAALDRAFTLHAATRSEPSVISDIRIDETISRIGEGLLAYENNLPDSIEFEELAFSLALREILASAIAEAAVVECGAERLLATCETIDPDFLIGNEKTEEEIGRELLDDEFDRMLEEAERKVDGEPNPETAFNQGLEDLFARRAPKESPEAKATPAKKKPAAKGAVSKLYEEGNAEDSKEVDAALRDLKKQAEEGRLAQIFGREDEIDRIVASLRRWRKGSIVIVGEPGVGKTALAEGLAARFVDGSLPASLRERPFYELSLTGLMANTRYRGEFEGRIRTFLERVVQERAIIFVDEVHMLMGVGASNVKHGGFDAANLLKPALARGDIAIIGATTPAELRVLRQDEAMMRRFDILHLKEPTREETIEILEKTGSACLAHHQVSAGPEVFARICEIADLYQPEKRFPDKAFDLLDMASLIAAEEGDEISTIQVDLAADRLGIRRPTLPDAQTMGRISDIPANVSKSAPGQDEALEILRDRLVGALLKPRNTGPRASLLISGKPGAGKTAAARGVAEALRLPLVTIDLRDAGHEGGKAFLLGLKGPLFQDVPGILTSSLETHRDAVIAIKGLEQADAEAIDVLTSLAHDSVIQNGQGQTFSLRGSVLMLMARADRDDHSGRPGFGIGSQDRHLGVNLPEALLGRLGAPIWFADPETGPARDAMESILDEILAEIATTGVTVTADAPVRAALIANCAGSGDRHQALEDQIMPALIRHFASNPTARKVRLEVDADQGVCRVA